MADSKEKLFSDFTAPSRQEWRDKIEVDLKGADYQKKMVWRTNEGFSMEPFYLKEDVDSCRLSTLSPVSSPTCAATRPPTTNGMSVRTSSVIARRKPMRRQWSS